MEIIVTATYVEKTLQSLTSLFMVWHRPDFEEGINKIALLENFNFECLLSSLANKAENMVKLKDKKIHENPILQLKDLPPTSHHQTLIMAKRILTIILINIEITCFSQPYLDFSDKTVFNGLSFDCCFHIHVVLHSYYSKIKLVLQIHLNSMHL